MELFSVIALFIMGLALGSFLTCITYRIPRGMTFLKGRSICPNCKHEIAWYDNIPVLSYLILRGNCRNCKEHISIRYPLIELSMGLLFAGSFLGLNQCGVTDFYFCNFTSLFGVYTLPFLLFNILIIASVFIVDLEHTIIPDEIVFLGLGVNVVLFFLTGGDLYTRLLAGLMSASFLLFLNLATRGRGMGLGDVKFAVYAGTLFSITTALTWLFLSFFIGAVIGVGLIAAGHAKFGAKIPFGPFLVISLIITLTVGNILMIFL